LSDPASATPSFALSFPVDGATGEIRINEPAMTDWEPPRRTTYMGWSRNYSVMSLNQIAGSVTLTNSAIYQAASRQTTSLDPWVAAGFPSSPVAAVNGGFAFQVDAQVEGDRQMRLLRTRREAFDVGAAIDPFADVVGRIVNLTNFNRLGMGASKSFFCYGITVNGTAVPILSLWG
jgi:hypothetical protein